MTRRSKLIWTVNTLVAFVLLSVIIFWRPIVYRTIAWVIDAQMSKVEGLTLTLADVQVSIFPPRVFIKGLDIAFQDGPLERVSVDHTLIRLGLTPALSGKLVISDVRVVHPTFWVNPSRSHAKPLQREASTKLFELPRPSDLFAIEIQNASFEQAELHLKVPGQALRVVVEEGKGSFSSGSLSQALTWRGSGSLASETKRVRFDDVFLAVLSDGDRVSIREMRLKGFGANLSLSGEAFPKSELHLKGDLDLEPLAQALDVIEATARPLDVSGKLTLDGQFKGELGKEVYSLSMQSERVRFSKKDLTELNVAVKGSLRELKQLKGHARLGGSKIAWEVSDLLGARPGRFKLESEAFVFEKFEAWLSPETSPLLRGNLSVSAEGYLRIQPFMLEGQYSVTSPLLRLDFDPDVYRFVPVQFSGVEIRGRLTGNREGVALTDGSLLAQGLEAKHHFSFPFKGGGGGEWRGYCHDVSAIFRSGHGVSGKTRVGGGLQLHPGNFEVRVDLGIDALERQGRDSVSGQGLLLFRKGETRVTNVALKSAQGGQLSFDSFFYPKQSGQLGWLKGSFEDWDLGWIADTTTVVYPFLSNITGRGQGSIELRDLGEQMSGSITLKSDEVTWGEYPSSVLDAHVALDRGTATFDGTSVYETQQSRIQGFFARLSGSVGREGFRQFKLVGARLPGAWLMPKGALSKELQVDTFDAVVDGQGEASSLSGKLAYRLGDTPGAATLSGTLWKPSWNLTFDDAALRAQGSYHFLSHNLELRAQATDFLLPWGKQMPLHVSGEAEFLGDMRRKETWRGQADFVRLDVDVSSQRTLKLKDTLELKISGQRLAISPVSFESERDSLSLEGGLDFSGKVDVRTQGYIDLEWLPSVVSVIKRSQGRLRFDMNLGGTLQDPLAKGRVEIQDGFVQLVNFPHPLEKLNMVGSLEQRLLFIDRLEADFAGGTLTSSGRMALHRDWKKIELGLTAQLQEVRLQYPSWFPADGSASLELSGPLFRPTLSGDVQVSQARYQDEWDWKSKVLSFRTSKSTSTILRQDSPTLFLNVRVASDRQALRIDNSIAQARLQADVNVTGSIHSPGLLGRIDVIGGTVIFLENRFILSSGQIVFSDRDVIRPVFDLNATTRVQQTDIFLDIRSQGDDIVAFLSSQPAKDETNLISLLTIGAESDQLFFNQEGASGANLSSSVVPGVLSGSLQSRLQEGLQETRIVDTVQFLPYFSDQSRDTGLRMVLGKELFPRVQLLYSTDLFNIGVDNTLRLQQDLSERVYILGSIRNNRVEQNREIDVGVDFEFRLDF